MHMNMQSFSLYQHILCNIFIHICVLSTHASVFTRTYFGLSEMCHTILTRWVPSSLTVLALWVRFQYLLPLACIGNRNLILHSSFESQNLKRQRLNRHDIFELILNPGSDCHISDSDLQMTDTTRINNQLHPTKGCICKVE